MKTGTLIRQYIVAVLILCSMLPAAAGNLAKDFQSPPVSAQPWVYWFWLNGNVTREGITADLEAMKRVGIGGVLIMEVDQGAPLGPVDFMSPKWRELFKHVVSEAQRLGLEVNMNNDAGWNGSGGPWIKPEQSMQKVVWSELDVEGSKHFEGSLPQPETVAGFYRDITVLVFPTPGSYRIPDISARAAYQVGGIGAPIQRDLLPEMLIDQSKIIDISEKMDTSGHLSWDVPPGKWTIVRFGHTSTGATNAPAPVSGTGLECDKLSKEGSDASFNGMMAKLIADVGPAAGKSLAATHVDSWENGSQNWTVRMPEEFRQRRGYDMLPLLPVMTGRVIGSPVVSERFLWDLRQTISELVVENYAGHIHELANTNGLRFTVEAYGSPCDSIPYGGQSDEPMGEFWVGKGYEPGRAYEICKGMASSGHVYGKNIIGAESFTSDDKERWLNHPASVKLAGDLAFCTGINRFVFHRYAMQPWIQDRKPGMTMGPWGLHYERTQTWWEQSKPWHEYLSRCQYMLRKGLFAADICYLQAETPPQSVSDHKVPGYGWDECSSEVVLTLMSVKNGRIMLPDGMSYRVLVLPETQVMTPHLVGKIKELVQAGATIIGRRPLTSPGLTDYPKCDDDVKRLGDEIWGNCDGQAVKERRFGKGRVVCGISPEEYLAGTGIKPDFDGDERLHYIHRIDGGTDIYFVANSQKNDVNAICTFRVTGRVPELWWPDTGRIERAGLYRVKDGVTSVLLPLKQSGSVFVVFRDKIGGSDSIVAVTKMGKPVLSTRKEDSPRVVIKRAVYGILDDPNRTRDVRDRVQKIVDSGKRSIPVMQMSGSGDPAFKLVKTLAVDYAIDGKNFHVESQDTDMVLLTDQAVKITVEKALYGILNDPKRTLDMRSKVQQIADSGQTSFQIAYLARDYDPAYMVLKDLILEYTINGKRITVTGNDGDYIDLSLHIAKPVPPYDLNNDGHRFKLTAWQPGPVELIRNSGRQTEITVPSLPAPFTVNSPWTILFPLNSGAPEQIKLDKLISLSDHPDTGVKYFSGTATYRTTFDAPESLFAKNRAFVLDLGNVQVMAEVILNGKDMGLLWKPPYSIDVTKIVKSGRNEIEVKVTNLWPNRMIGDEQLPEDSDRSAGGTINGPWPQWLLDGKPSPAGRYTFTSWRLWKKDDALLPSGLIGPVTLRAGYTAVID
ncbi:MAG: glycosyl hydrolase [Armatimonadota bacterium]